jgi:hypothetical protein
MKAKSGASYSHPYTKTQTDEAIWWRLPLERPWVAAVGCLSKLVAFAVRETLGFGWNATLISCTKRRQTRILGKWIYLLHLMKI